MSKSISKLKKEYLSNLPKYKAFGYAIYEFLNKLKSETEDEILKIEWRIKSIESVIEKVEKKSVESLKEISDILGFRLTVNNYADIDQINKKILERFPLKWDNTDKRENRIHKSIQYFHYNLIANKELVSDSDSIEFELQVKSEIKSKLDILSYELSYPSKTLSELNIAMSNFIQKLLNKSKPSKTKSVITQFLELLNKKDVHEKKDIHPFINKYSSILLESNSELIMSERQIGIGKKFQIDFLIKKPGNNYVLVEIENPKHRICNKNKNFSAAVNHAIEQVEDWQEWIEDNLPSVQKVYPGMKSPEGIVIIGRSIGLSKYEIEKINRRNINMRGRIILMTYDDLIDKAKASIYSIEQYLRNNEKL